MAPTTEKSVVLDLAFEKMPIPALVIDGKNRILQATKSADSLLERDPQTLVGEDLTEVIQSDDPTWWSGDPVDDLGSSSSGRKI
ncbi:MAG: PAS domain-containing protein, partial [Candidatus Eisenbacteria bacterium]|nr:PAS domain-containing protein [Candidatus Eisenbacteria bacterium]